MKFQENQEDASVPDMGRQTGGYGETNSRFSHAQGPKKKGKKFIPA
jgi:hypothetical protein